MPNHYKLLILGVFALVFLPAPPHSVSTSAA